MDTHTRPASLSRPFWGPLLLHNKDNDDTSCVPGWNPCLLHRSFALNIRQAGYFCHILLVLTYLGSNSNSSIDFSLGAGYLNRLQALLSKGY